MSDGNFFGYQPSDPMCYNPIHFIRCLILCLAGYAIHVPLAPITVFGEEPKSQVLATPKIDHILLEVSNLTASIAFYRDFLGLRLESQSDWFVIVESTYWRVPAQQPMGSGKTAQERGTAGTWDVSSFRGKRCCHYGRKGPQSRLPDCPGAKKI